MSACLNQQKVDLVVHNATIYSMDEDFTTYQAMAVHNGRILEMGPEHQILNKYMGKERLDAAKRFIYPGFIDAHCHFLYYGLGLQQVNLVGTTSYQEVLDRVVAKSTDIRGVWIQGRGWDQNDWKDQSFPTRAALDSLFPDRPVALQRIDGHAALVNKKALELAGITANTTVEGGAVMVENGEPTGILVDKAFDLVDAVIPPPTEIELTKALLDAQADCFAAGITSVGDAGLKKSDIDAIKNLHEIGELKMRIYAMLSDNEENFGHYLANGPEQTDRLTVKSFKFYADGALGSRGACLLEPYADDPSQGFLLSKPEYFAQYAPVLKAAGFQMNTHCIGDSALRMILNLYAETLEGNNDLRWRIEHCQLVHPDDLTKFGENSIIPSVQPTHATSDMYWAKDRIGPEREKTAYAFKELLEQSGVIALGTDFPVEGIDPLRTFYSAVFRQDSAGFPEGGYQMENALSRKETLYGMTLWAALSNFEEAEKGSLQPGKVADFVLLNGDLMTITPELYDRLKVLRTYSGGTLVHKQ